jgi:site-specific DNA recombinase
MKVGIYCRVSSDDQVANGLSMIDQELRGIEYCNKHGYEYEVFRDPAVSGTTLITERKYGFQLIQKTEKKKNKKTDQLESELDGVYITDWDRLSRNDNDRAFIQNHFLTNKIKYIELGEVKDLNDPNQQLLMSVKSILSAYEIKKLQVRIKRGLERSVAEGNAGGGSMVNYGYKKDSNKKLIIDESEAEVIKIIFQLSLEGIGVKKIANYLNDNNIPTKRMITGDRPMKVRGVSKTEFLWRDSVVYSMLKNPLYKGERLFRGTIYNAPNIVSKEEFDLVQELFKSRKNTKDTTNRYFYLLKGLIFCDRCRSRFYGRTREDLSDNQYICSSQRYRDTYCGNRGINIPKLNNMVWDSLISLPKDLLKINNPEDNIRLRKLKRDIGKYKIQINKNTSEINRLISLFQPNEEGYKYLKPGINNLVKRNSQLDDKLNLLETELRLNSSEELLIERLDKQINAIKKKQYVSEIEKQTILRSYVNQIDVLWNNELRNHIITIDFKYDSKSDTFYEKVIKINYVKSGWRFDEGDLSYEFHKKIPKLQSINDVRRENNLPKKSSIEMRLKTPKDMRRKHK